MADEIADAIDANAAGPRKVTADGITVEQHAIPDQIAWAQHKAATAAAKNRKLGIRFRKLIPPGAD